MDRQVTFSFGDSPVKLRVYVTDTAMDSTNILSEEQSIKTVERMRKERSDLSKPNRVSAKKGEAVDQPDTFRSSGDFPAKLRVYITDVAVDFVKIISEEQSIKTVASVIQEESAESSVSIRSDESMDRPDSVASENSFL